MTSPNTTKPLRSLQGKSNRPEDRAGNGPQKRGSETAAKNGPSNGGRFLARELNSRIWGRDSRAGSSPPAIASCGRALGADVIGVVESDAGWWSPQVATCKDAKVCDFCAGRHQAEKRDRARWHVESWLAGGGSVFHVTLTVPHRRGHGLCESLAALKGSERRLRSYSSWDCLDIEDWIRVLHVSWTVKNGWHPHFHVLLLADGDTDVALLEAFLSEDWEAATASEGRPASQKGFRARQVDNWWDALYPFHYAPDGEADDRYHPSWDDDLDWDPRHEFDVDSLDDDADPWDGGYSPWSIASAAHKGSRRAGAMWIEYREAMVGERLVAHSKGLSDAWKAREVPAEETPEPVVFVSSWLWNKARFRPAGGVAESGLEVGYRRGVGAMAQHWASALGLEVQVSELAGVPLVTAARSPGPPGSARSRARCGARG